MLPLADYDIPSLQRDLSAADLRASHATAILREFFQSAGAPEFDRRRFGHALTARLTAHPPLRSKVRLRSEASDGTTKLLIALPDGAAVESVLMPAYRDGRAMACVSSQVGCAMGCDFCASTVRGLERDLSAGEIVEQFLHLSAEAKSRGRRVSSLVFMGMGEPLANYDAVVAAIRRINHPQLGALGKRHITVSTVGLVPAMDRLAAEGFGVHLALSLHAPDDATRALIVPTNRRWNVADVLSAARRYQDATGRIVTIEYCLLSGVNDSDDHAAMLADRLAGFRCHVNVIPFNPIGPGPSGVVHVRPSPQRVQRFIAILRERGTVAHPRATRGDDVNAACGQLRETAAMA